jgi:hypothetical protein
LIITPLIKGDAHRRKKKEEKTNRKQNWVTKISQVLGKQLAYRCSIKLMSHECKESECEQGEKSGCCGPKEYTPGIQVFPRLKKIQSNYYSSELV